MEAAEIIEYLHENDFEVKTDGEYLELFPAEKVTDDLILRVQKHKPAIIALLTHNQELVIRAWLTQIDEPGEEHYLVLNKCRRDSDAFKYFLEQAKGYEQDC